MGSKKEFKRWDSFGWFTSDFEPRGLLNNERHLDFSTSYCLSNTELWQDVSSAGYQARMGEHLLSGTVVGSFAAKNLPTLLRDVCPTALTCQGQLGGWQADQERDPRPWVRFLALLESSAEPTQMGRKEKTGVLWWKCSYHRIPILSDPTLSEFGSMMAQTLIYCWVSFGINFISWKRASQENDMAVRRFLYFVRQVILKYFLMDG